MLYAQSLAATITGPGQQELSFPTIAGRNPSFLGSTCLTPGLEMLPRIDWVTHFSAQASPGTQGEESSGGNLKRDYFSLTRILKGTFKRGQCADCSCWRSIMPAALAADYLSLAL